MITTTPESARPLPENIKPDQIKHRYRIRKSLFGKCILQRIENVAPSQSYPVYDWVDIPHNQRHTIGNDF